MSLDTLFLRTDILTYSLTLIPRGAFVHNNGAYKRKVVVQLYNESGWLKFKSHAINQQHIPAHDAF
jgi:hypothetical protein